MRLYSTRIPQIAIDYSLTLRHIGLAVNAGEISLSSLADTAGSPVTIAASHFFDGWL
jgi:hypothetical protein